MTLRRARQEGLLDAEDTAAIFFETHILDDRVSRLRASFPDSTLHAIAIKTNPLQFVLKHLRHLGTGLEAASIAEVRLAMAARISNHEIVFDSPAKTRAEIEFLSQACPGIRINADSIEELSRYHTNMPFQLGLRINPHTGSETLGYLGVATPFSKFGESISNRTEIIQACLKTPALDCLHYHIGSQHNHFEPVFAATEIILSLANEINIAAGQRKIKKIDIGGGFPVNYLGPPFAIEPFAKELANRCPDLFSSKYELITELGRYVHANAAWAATRIESVKSTPRGFIAVTHLGADMFLRECYNPEDWYHDILVFDQNGNPKSGPESVVDIAGPLCFGGDFIQREVTLPRIAEGDWLVIKDIGANTFSLWSRHCSRPFPKVLSRNDQQLRIEKHQESFESILDFWS